MRAVEEAEDVELDHPAPLLHRRADDGPEEHDAGVVDQGVEAAERGHRLVHHGRACASSVTSVSSTSTWSRPMRSASSSRRSRRRAATATRAPCAAREMAVACPMPLEAPVTRATVPSSRSVMGGLPSSSPRTPARRQRRSVPRRYPTTDGPVRRGSGQAADLWERRTRVPAPPPGADRGVEGAPRGGRALVQRAPVGAVVPAQSHLARGLDAHPTGPEGLGRDRPGQPFGKHRPVIGHSTFHHSTALLARTPGSSPDGVPSLRAASRRPDLE